VVTVLAGLAGITLIALVQELELQFQRISTLGAIGLVSGAILWAVALRSSLTNGGQDVPGSSRPCPLLVRWPVALVAGGLAAAAWADTAAGAFSQRNVALWVGALVGWCVACWPRSPVFSRRVASSGLRSHVHVIAGLGAIVVVGAFFRFYRLHELPGEPTSDHAEKLLDIWSLLAGERPVFFATNAGREPGQFYVTYGLVEVFGMAPSFDTLKIGTAFVGVLAVLAVFLLAREVAGTFAGLAAAVLTAVSAWPTTLDRIGLRMAFATLASALALWLLFRYIRTRDRRDAVLCGVVAGLGLYGYTPFRIVALFLAGVAVVAAAHAVLPTGGTASANWAARVRLGRGTLADLAAGAGAALIAAIPLVHYSVRFPDQFWYRVRTRVTSESDGVIDAVVGLSQNEWNALRAFNWRGDSTSFAAVTFDPFLDSVTGALLVAGVALAATIAVRHRDLRPALLLVALPVLVLPSSLNLALPHENPSANRLIAAAPVVFTLAALPLSLVVRGLWHAGSPTAEARRVAPRIAATGIATTALLLAAYSNFTTYFRTYDRQYHAFVPGSSEVAGAIRRAVRTGVPLRNVYLLAYPHWLDGRNVGFALNAPAWQRTHDIPSSAPLPDLAGVRPLVFVLHAGDKPRYRTLMARFPDGGAKPVRSKRAGKDFVLYFVPALRESLTASRRPPPARAAGYEAEPGATLREWTSSTSTGSSPIAASQASALGRSGDGRLVAAPATTR
jgi:hypothetical protein